MNSKDWEYKGKEKLTRAYRHKYGAFGISAEMFVWERPNGARKYQGDVALVPIRGQAPTLLDVFAALYVTEDAMGPELYERATHAHIYRPYPWRVDTRVGMSGCRDLTVREQDDIAKELGTAGAISSRFHISCANKFNNGMSCRLRDWYVFVNEMVPRLDDTLGTLRELYPEGYFTPILAGRSYNWLPGGSVYGWDPEHDGFDGPEPGYADILAVKVLENQRAREEYWRQQQEEAEPSAPRERLHFEDDYDDAELPEGHPDIIARREPEEGDDEEE